MLSTTARTSACSVLCSWIWLLWLMLIESTPASAARMIPMIARTTSISLRVRPASWRSRRWRDRITAGRREPRR